MIGKSGQNGFSAVDPLFSDSLLALQIGDIDAQRKQAHIRRGKGHKDRFVPLPDLTYRALRTLWCNHRNPCWLFPNAVGSQWYALVMPLRK